MEAAAGFKLRFAQHYGRAGDGLQGMGFAGCGKAAGQVLVEVPHRIEGIHIDAAVLHGAVRIQKQRPSRADLGIGHDRTQRRQPARGKRGVVVEKKQQISASRLSPGIAAPCKTRIFSHAHGLE